MIEQDRLVCSSTQGEEEAIEHAIRPRQLDEYVGQPAVKKQMSVFIQAARGIGQDDACTCHFE
jgi:Holliday junction DNA helicase RuvB